MLQVSDAYKELVKSNIRPKCEPIIKISGTDNEGKEIELIWKAKNIKDLKYKRAIDPVGRELPYMELNWTEIYTGKLNAESYPEKYNNIAKYMQVELSFVQDLAFYNTWKTLFNGGATWKELFSKTWKRVKNETTQEVITMPKMFLSAKPTISGQTITWTAKDLIGFINENDVAEFLGGEDVTLTNVLSYFVLNARGSFLNSKKLFTAYTDTVTQLLNQYDIVDKIDKRIICDGNTNNIILNLASIYNYYWDFKNNIATLNKFNPTNYVFEYNKNMLFSYPKIEKSTNISSYNFKHSVAEADKTKGYIKASNKIEPYGESAYIITYFLDEYGEAYNNKEDAENDENRINVGSIKTALKMDLNGNPSFDIYVIPVKLNHYENIINIDNVGETFNENNPINPYDAQSDIAISRKDFLCSYFTDKSSSISFEALPNIAVETGDVIQIETNLYDENGQQIFKNALIVEIELNYNGSLKQKIKAHEVRL